MTLTDEPWLPRISCYSVSGLDNNFRDSVRARDGRCVVSGIVNELAPRGRWDSFEVGHVFPLEWESVWTDEKYGRWIKGNDSVESIAQMNSPQNGILLTSNLRRWFDQYLFSINPDVGGTSQSHMSFEHDSLTLFFSSFRTTIRSLSSAKTFSR